MCLFSTLFVVGILGVVTRMGSWGEVLITVCDQWGEWVDCMGRLHNGDLVRLWRDIREGFKKKTKKHERVVTLYMSLNHIIPCAIWLHSLSHDLGDWYVWCGWHASLYRRG